MLYNLAIVLNFKGEAMKKYLKSVKDFADVMATVNFDNLTENKSINEMDLNELQSYIDFYQTHEIPYIYEALKHAESEKEIKFLTWKLEQAQLKVFEYSTQHIKLAFKLQ